VASVQVPDALFNPHCDGMFHCGKDTLRLYPDLLDMQYRFRELRIFAPWIGIHRALTMLWKSIFQNTPF